MTASASLQIGTATPDGGGAAATLIVRNALAREGLHRILTDGGYAVVRAGADAADLRNRTWTTGHLVIVDSGSFDLAGFDANLDGLDVAMPHVVVLGDGFDLDLMFRIFAAGGRGYLITQETHHALLIKLALVIMGERVVPSAFFDTLSRLPGRMPLVDCESLDVAMLGMRGQAILAGLVHGMSNKSIAHELCLSELTVKTAVRTVLRKLKVNNRTQAAIKGRDNDMIQSTWERSCLLKLEGPRGI